MTTPETLTEDERVYLERETFTIRKLLRIHDALQARVRLAREVADNCSGDYMRAILDGEIDAAEHAARRL